MHYLQSNPKLLRWPVLPVATILVCAIFSCACVQSGLLTNRIEAIHTDPFSLDRALRQLSLSKTIIPSALAASLAFYLFWRYRGESQNILRIDLIYSALVTIVTWTLALRLWQCPVAVDDSYVDYRYVQHWLGGELDYNSGSHVMGFTSHLHLIVLWLICSLLRSGAVDYVSYFLNCALDSVSVVFIFFICRQIYGRLLPAAIAAACFAINIYSCNETFSGKETALVSLFLLLALWAVQTARYNLLPWFANALFLLRPEGVIACVVVLAMAIKKQGLAAWRSLLIPCAVSALWYIALLIYFGTIVPHGMIAKRIAFMPAPVGGELLKIVELIGLQFSNDCLFLLIPNCPLWPFAVLTVLALSFALIRFKEPAPVLYRNIVLAQLAFLLLARPSIFSWYFCWFNLLSPILAAELCAILIDTSGHIKKTPLLLARTAAVIVLVLYSASGFFLSPYTWTPYIRRVIVYHEAASYLLAKTGGHEPIAASDVGTLGYFYPGKIIDVMGLVSDDTLKYYPVRTTLQTDYLIPPAAIKAIKPAYLLAPLVHCQGLLLDDADFKKNYIETKRWTDPQMNGRVICIWERINQTR